MATEPPTGDGGETGRRPARALLSVSLAVLLGAGVGTLVNVTTGDGGPSGSRAGRHDAEQVQAPPVPEPISLSDLAGSIAVVETGFTTMHRVSCRSAADQDTTDGCYGCSIAEGCATRPPEVEDLLSLGVVVRNGSDRLLQRIPLRIGVVDGAGQPVNPASGAGETELQVSRLLPNETVGLGRVLTLDRAGATAVTVEVGAPDESSSVNYAEATGDLAAVYQVTTSGVTVAAGPNEGTFTVRFALEGSLPDDVVSGDEPARLLAQPQVIYRDAANRIVGGDGGDTVEIDVLDPRRAEIRVPSPGVPWSRTDVYLTGFTVA